MFGQAVLLGPDADRDGVPDLIVSAPLVETEPGSYQGLLFAFSVASGEQLWTVQGDPGQALGWDMALADDHDGDGGGIARIELLESLDVGEGRYGLGHCSGTPARQGPDDVEQAK